MKIRSKSKMVIQYSLSSVVSTLNPTRKTGFTCVEKQRNPFSSVDTSLNDSTVTTCYVQVYRVPPDRECLVFRLDTVIITHDRIELDRFGIGSYFKHCDIIRICPRTVGQCFQCDIEFNQNVRTHNSDCDRGDYLRRNNNGGFTTFVNRLMYVRMVIITRSALDGQNLTLSFKSISNSKSILERFYSKFPSLSSPKF